MLGILGTVSYNAGARAPVRAGLRLASKLYNDLDEAPTPEVQADPVVENLKTEVAPEATEQVESISEMDTWMATLAPEVIEKMKSYPPPACLNVGTSSSEADAKRDQPSAVSTAVGSVATGTWTDFCVDCTGILFNEAGVSRTAGCFLTNGGDYECRDPLRVDANPGFMAVVWAAGKANGAMGCPRALPGPV